MTAPKRLRASAKPAHARPSRKAKVVIPHRDAHQPIHEPTQIEQPFAGEPVASGLTRFWKWLKG